MLALDDNADQAVGMKQSKLYDLMPGARGGETLRDTYGEKYLKEIASRGGAQTFKLYGADHMRKIGKNGAKARLEKRDSGPNTVKYWDGSIRRVIPYNHKTRSKKQRYVHILLFPDDGVI